MKKILALILGLTFILSLSACDKGPTAEELYALATEKSAAADKLDSAVSMMGKITINSEGGSQDIDFDMTGSVIGENIGKESMKMAMPMKVNMMGVSLDTNMYFTDGWYLMEMAGEKLKCPMDVEKALEQFASIELQPMDYVTLGKMTKDNTSNLYTIPYSMDMTKALEMSLGSLTMAGMDPSNIEGIIWDNCTGTIEVDKDGNIKHQESTISFSATIQEIDMDCEMVVLASYNEIGENFSVSVPDASEYTEVPAENLGISTAE